MSVNYTLVVPDSTENSKPASITPAGLTTLYINIRALEWGIKLWEKADPEPGPTVLYL